MAETASKSVLVTIIVPVHQAEDHLDECLSSLVAQTYTSLEIILSDDGSTDGSGALCDEWARRDPRVLVIHAANGGLSVARNRGIERATGAFISFVDADDVVAPTYVATLVDAAVGADADLVLADLVSFADSGEGPAFRPGTSLREETSDEALARIVASGVGFASCGKLIASEVFADLRFRPRSDFEDLHILPRMLGRAQRVVVSDAAEYGYRQHQGSLMDGHRRLLSPTILEVLRSNIDYAAEAETDEARRRDIVLGYVLHAMKTLEAASPGTARRAPGYDTEYRRFMGEHLPVLMSSSQISRAYKVAAVLSVASPGVFVRAVRVASRVKSRVAPGLRRRSGQTTAHSSGTSAASG